MYVNRVDSLEQLKTVFKNEFGSLLGLHNLLSSSNKIFKLIEAKRIWDLFEYFLYAKKHRSWLKMVEIDLNVLNKNCLIQKIDNRDKIISKEKAWQNHIKNIDAKINWQFANNDESSIKLNRLYPFIDA